MKRKVLGFFLILALNIFADDVDKLKDKVKNIDSQIKEKSNRIEYIKNETVSLENQIKNIQKEISDLEKNTIKLQDEIRVVNRNIDYGEQNLKLSNSVYDIKKNEFKAKMVEINRKKDLESNSREKSVAKRSFSRLLYSDLESMEHIKEVQSSIGEVKKNIEKEKIKLTELKRKLDSNIRKTKEKQNEQKNLITRLNQEKINHEKSITTLTKEKERIEKEIEKIIKARSTTQKDIKLNTALSKLGKFVKPVQGATVVKFKSLKNGKVVSNGIEIKAPIGSKIKAAMTGKVIYADKFQGLNNVVMIDYGYNTIGVYGNLIGIGVKLNQQVQKGQDIGVLGLNTDGESNLYYEVRFNLKPINPEDLF